MENVHLPEGRYPLSREDAIGRERRVFHYTTARAYEEMSGFVAGMEPTGLLPRGNLLVPGVYPFPTPQPYRPASFGLLEPEPPSWTRNSEFPDVWRRLMLHLRGNRVALLSFELEPEDEADVVDWAHRERVQHASREEVKEAWRRYWESRVPALDYRGGHTLPEVVIWTPIAADRLLVEWVKDSGEVWKRINQMEPELAA